MDEETPEQPQTIKTQLTDYVSRHNQLPDQTWVPTQERLISRPVAKPVGEHYSDTLLYDELDTDLSATDSSNSVCGWPTYAIRSLFRSHS